MDEGPIEGRLGGAAHSGVGLGAELHGLGGAPLQPLLALSSIAELRLQALHKEQATLVRHDAAAAAAGLQAAKTRTGGPALCITGIIQPVYASARCLEMGKGNCVSKLELEHAFSPACLCHLPTSR